MPWLSQGSLPSWGELGGLRPPEASVLEHHLCHILLVEGNWKAEGGEKSLIPSCFLPQEVTSFFHISDSFQTSRKGPEVDSLKAGLVFQQGCKGPRFYLLTLPPVRAVFSS